MPYELKREGAGYKIVSTDTGATHSDRPLPRQRALAQMRALDANVPDAQTNVPGYARGGKINLSGKQKKSKGSSSNNDDRLAKMEMKAPATADIPGLPPAPNGMPPLMALHGKPHLKMGGTIAMKTSKGGPNSSGLFNGQSDFAKSRRQPTQNEMLRGGKMNFIAGAIKKPGALHAELGVPKDEKIPAGKLATAAKSKGKLGQRARFAETLKGLGK